MCIPAFKISPTGCHLIYCGIFPTMIYFPALSKSIIPWPVSVLSPAVLQFSHWLPVVLILVTSRSITINIIIFYHDTVLAFT